MKECPIRYINPFLSDEENDKVDFTSNLDNMKFEKSLESSNDPSESVEKAKEVYIDKNVTECQLPEMITCYQETGFNVVKDICVDEGLSHGEIIKSDKEHHELSFNPVTVNGDKHDHIIDDIIKDYLDTQLTSTPLEDKIQLFIESNNVNSREICDPDNSLQSGDEKLDSGSISLNNSIRVLEPVDNDVDDVDQQLSEAQSTGSEANEPRQTNHTTDTPNKTMEENTSLNSDNVKPTTASGPNEPPLNTQSNNDDMASSNLTLAARGGGESSFSMAGPVSGLITYLGPVTASGSLSHRSDGSNTSVRSFAFPILQNEWNSSPVRMAKAGPKQSRKHQGWRQALMCCRF